MSKTRSLLIVGASEREQEAIRRQVDGIAEVVGTERDADRAMAAIREKSASVALLYMDHDPDSVLALSREVVRVNGCAPIVVSRDRDPDTILQAMRSGVRDFAYLDEEEQDIRRAVLNLGAVSETDDEGRRGQVLSFFSSKGGSGATTLATNLAGALQVGAEARTVVVDLDFQMGDVLVFLDLASRYSFNDLIKNLPRLDDELVHRSLTTHNCGLRVLAQSDNLEEADEVDAKAVTRAIHFLRQHYDYVVVDGIRDFNERAVSALDSSDQILLTFTQDVPALKNANRCLQIFQRLGYSRQKIKLILNRYHKRGKPDLDSIADALGTEVHGTVANDFPAVIKAINEGELLAESAPRARVSRDIRSLLPVVGASADQPRRGLLGRVR